MRQLALESEVTESPAGGARAGAEVRALVDQVPSGRHSFRFEAVFRPGVRGEPAPEAEITVTAGRRSPTTFLVAAGLILLPPLVQLGSRLRRRRSAPAEANDDADVDAA